MDNLDLLISLTCGGSRGAWRESKQTQVEHVNSTEMLFELKNIFHIDKNLIKLNDLIAFCHTYIHQIYEKSHIKMTKT